MKFYPSESVLYHSPPPNAFPNGKGLPYLSHAELHLLFIHNVVKFPQYLISEHKERQTLD